MKLIITVFFLALVSCNTRNIKNSKELVTNQLDVFKNEDLVSYIRLYNYYDNDSSYYNLLPYSLHMLKKSEIGHFDFFSNYLKISFNNEYNPKDILKLDKPEMDFLIYVLQLGAIKEDFNCRKVLSDYYRNGIVVEKNIIAADSIYKKLGYNN